jgi:hypothetical protein
MMTGVSVAGENLRDEEDDAAGAEHSKERRQLQGHVDL